VLAEEQQTCVREAIWATESSLRERPLQHSQQREAMLAATRDVAGYLATRLREQRMNVLQELAQRNEIDNVRESFPRIVAEVRDSNDSVVSIAIELAERSLAGEDIDDELAVTSSGIMREEAFSQRLRDAATPPHRLTFAEWRAMGATRLELAVGWITDVVRILAEEGRPRWATFSVIQCSRGGR
jgi:hypothetical protein